MPPDPPDDWRVGDVTGGGVVVTSVVRSGGRVAQLGVRGPIDAHGMAWHWSIDPATCVGLARPVPQCRYVGRAHVGV